MDRFSALFSRFSPQARVFHTGALCQTASFDAQDGVGYLHLLRRGPLLVHTQGYAPLELREPSALFYPRACGHRLSSPDPAGADLICASLLLGRDAENPLVFALPERLVVPLAGAPLLDAALELLFGEGMAEHCGRQAALDRLMEYILIQLMRHVVDGQQHRLGLLAALADRRLSRAVTAMHENPERAWTLEALAEQAGMSRARFAFHFRNTVGTTPLDYLTTWRLGLAQNLLAKGEPVKAVTRAVGYRSPAALSRVFTQRLGVSPTQWLADKSATSSSP